MLPTTRAQALLPAIRSALAEVRRVLGQNGGFEPKTAQITWQIAAADYGEYAVLLPLLTKLRRVPPGIRLSIRQASHAKMFKQLDSGAIDLALLAMDTLPSHLQHRILYKEHYVLVARKGHPALKRKLTLETFCELDYIVVSPDGGGFKGMTDAMLESRGRKRRVSLSTQHLLFMPEVVMQTDLVAVAPHRLVKDRADRLQIMTPPLAIPSYDMAMIWHERSHADPAHVWLREQLAS